MSKTEAARDAASDLQRSPLLQGLARVGFVVNGVLHMLIGVIALTVAFGGVGDASEEGALTAIAETPFGDALLWVVAIGLWALALFQVLETAIIRGSNARSWGRRAKEAGKGIAYAALGFAAFGFAMPGGSGGGESAESVSARILSAPGGVVILLLVAAGVCAIGIYFIQKGARQGFLEDIAVPRHELGKATIAAGVIGYIAQGIAIVTVGILFGVAAATSDPSEASGLDGALKSLIELPFGVVILGAVALGLIAFGIYCFLRARYARL